MSDRPHAGARVFSEFFSSYVPVERDTAFDGEIAAIRTALSQLQKAVILGGSRAALLAVVSENNPITQDILDCRNHLKSLASLGKTIVLQWVPAHCGVPGIEKADFLAKKSDLIMQNISLPMPFHTIKNL